MPNDFIDETNLFEEYQLNSQCMMKFSASFESTVFESLQQEKERLQEETAQISHKYMLNPLKRRAKPKREKVYDVDKVHQVVNTDSLFTLEELSFLDKKDREMLFRKASVQSSFNIITSILQRILETNHRGQDLTHSKSTSVKMPIIMSKMCWKD